MTHYPQWRVMARRGPGALSVGAGHGPPEPAIVKQGDSRHTGGNDLPMRRSPAPRLKGWNYRAARSYFVTAVTHHRQLLFGWVEDGRVLLSRLGAMVELEWFRWCSSPAFVETSSFLVMPNHLHAIVF